MIHKLYKVAGRSDGLRGRFRFENKESLWLHKRDADNAIACGSGIAVRCHGECAPYFAVLEYEGLPSNRPHPQNFSRAKTWMPPEKHTIIPSNEYLQKYGSQEAPKKEEKPSEKPVDTVPVPSMDDAGEPVAVGPESTIEFGSHVLKRKPGRPRKEANDV